LICSTIMVRGMRMLPLGHFHFLVHVGCGIGNWAVLERGAANICAISKFL
jgi:hypothetical protein